MRSEDNRERSSPQGWDFSDLSKSNTRQVFNLSQLEWGRYFLYRVRFSFLMYGVGR